MAAILDLSVNWISHARSIVQHIHVELMLQCHLHFSWRSSLATFSGFVTRKLMTRSSVSPIPVFPIPYVSPIPLCGVLREKQKGVGEWVFGQGQACTDLDSVRRRTKTSSRAGSKRGGRRALVLESCWCSSFLPVPRRPFHPDPCLTKSLLLKI